MTNAYGSDAPAPLARMRRKGTLPKGPTRGAPPVGTKEIAGKVSDLAGGAVAKVKALKNKLF